MVPMSGKDECTITPERVCLKGEISLKVNLPSVQLQSSLKKVIDLYSTKKVEFRHSSGSGWSKILHMVSDHWEIDHIRPFHYHTQESKV